MENPLNYKNFFKGKKITVHGLGLLGRGIGDVIFLAQNGADLVVTDLKNKEQLSSSLTQIKKALKPEVFKKIKFVLGEHRLEDFRNRDFILKAAGVPIESVHIAEARKNNIPIKMDASWFAELAPAGVKIIGITGTRGKSTVTHLIFNIIEEALRLRSGQKHPRVFLGGNVRGLATLPLLKKVNPPTGGGDIVVMELDSWQLQGFGDSQISPNISVFTNLMVDHQNYYQNDMDKYFADKANIYRFQKEGDYLIAGQEIAKKINPVKLASLATGQERPTGKLIVPDVDIVPKSWKVKLIGEHNLLNIAYAITVARILDIPEKVIKQAVEKYSGVPGRLEFLREVKGVKYYNDTTATTPDGVMAALKALSGRQGLPFGSSSRGVLGDIILIGGGRDKELDYKKYAPVVKKSVKALALFQGTATDKIIKILGPSTSLRASKTKLPVKIFDNMPEAFAWANSFAQKGDVVLLSPGAASFGVFKNEFDRGDQFVKEVKKVK